MAQQFQIRGYPAIFVIDQSEPRSVPNYRDVQVFYGALAGQDAESSAPPKDDHYRKGVALVDQGRRVEAAYEFQLAVRQRPDAAAYDYLAWLAAEKSDWGETLDYATKMINLDPQYDHGRGYAMRALANWHLQKTFEASQDADRGCRLGDQECCAIKRRLAQMP